MAWPTTDNPRERFVTLRLSAQEFADLEVYAKRFGMSRSSAVRSALIAAIGPTKPAPASPASPASPAAPADTSDPSATPRVKQRKQRRVSGA